MPNVRSITCTFLNQPLENTKHCSANITYGANCDQSLGAYSGSSTGPSDFLSTSPIDLLNDIAEYCFIVTASSGNVTVVVEGTLNLINIGNYEHITCDRCSNYFFCCLQGVSTLLQ